MTTETPVAAATASTELARECLYRFFAAALSDPGGPGWGPLANRDDRWLAAAAAEVLRGEIAVDPVPLGYGERPADDIDLYDALDKLDRCEDVGAEYDRVFGLAGSRACSPCGTEYGPTNEPFFRAQQLADVAGFYAAFGVAGGRARPERPDHIALELEFMAHLLLKQRLADGERAAVCADAARAFFRDHLAAWVPSFAASLERRAGDGFYAEIARALAAFVPAERARFDIKAPRKAMRPAPTEPPEEDVGCGGCPTGV